MVELLNWGRGLTDCTLNIAHRMVSKARKLLVNESDADYSSVINGSLSLSIPGEIEEKRTLLHEEGRKYGDTPSTSAENIALLESLLRETASSVKMPPALVVGSAPVSSTSSLSEEMAEDHRRPSRAYSHQGLLFLPEFQRQTDQLLNNIESSVVRTRRDVNASVSNPLATQRFDRIREAAETLVVLQRRLEETMSSLFDAAVRYDRLSGSGEAVQWLRTRERRKRVLEKSIHDLLVDTNAELVSGNRPTNMAFESNVVTRARLFRVRVRHVISIVLLLVVWSVLMALTWHTYLGHYDWLVLLRVVRSPLLIVSYAYLIAINMKVWAVLKIDYVAIFRFHADTAPTPKYAFRAAIGFTALFSGIIAAYLLLSAVLYNTGLIIAVGVIMWTLLVAFSLNPLDVFCRSGRYALIRSLGRTISAPFFKVQFGDGWLGDQLVSLVIVFLDLEYFFCYCIYATSSGPVTAFDASVCTSNVNYVRPIITILPTTWRFFQCLRGYVDTWNSLHLWNAGKYFTTYPVVVFATAYRPQIITFVSLFEFTFDNVGWVVFFWMLSSLLNAVYCFIWDVAFDWKLVYVTEHQTVHCHFFKRRSPHVRKSCLFRQPWYFLAIAIDFVFRFLWSLKISLAVVWRVNSDLLFTALNFAEFFRRFVWNFLRVELQWIEIKPKDEIKTESTLKDSNLVVSHT